MQPRSPSKQPLYPAPKPTTPKNALTARSANLPLLPNQTLRALSHKAIPLRPNPRALTPKAAPQPPHPPQKTQQKTTQSPVNHSQPPPNPTPQSQTPNPTAQTQDNPLSTTTETSNTPTTNNSHYTPQTLHTNTIRTLRTPTVTPTLTHNQHSKSNKKPYKTHNPLTKHLHPPTQHTQINLFHTPIFKLNFTTNQTPNCHQPPPTKTTILKNTPQNTTNKPQHQHSIHLKLTTNTPSSHPYQTHPQSTHTTHFIHHTHPHTPPHHTHHPLKPPPPKPNKHTTPHTHTPHKPPPPPPPPHLRPSPTITLLTAIVGGPSRSCAVVDLRR